MGKIPKNANTSLNAQPDIKILKVIYWFTNCSVWMPCFTTADLSGTLFESRSVAHESISSFVISLSLFEFEFGANCDLTEFFVSSKLPQSASSSSSQPSPASKSLVDSEIK